MRKRGKITPPPMLQIGGGTVRSERRRDWADAENDADLPFIYLNSFDQGTNNIATRLEISILQPIFDFRREGF
jgi:hypothetical protein